MVILQSSSKDSNQENINIPHNFMNNSNLSTDIDKSKPTSIVNRLTLLDRQHDMEDLETEFAKQRKERNELIKKLQQEEATKQKTRLEQRAHSSTADNNVVTDSYLSRMGSAFAEHIKSPFNLHSSSSPYEEIELDDTNEIDKTDKGNKQDIPVSPLSCCSFLTYNEDDELLDLRNFEHRITRGQHWEYDLTINEWRTAVTRCGSLEAFLEDIYEYYEGKGYMTLIITHTVLLLTKMFIVALVLWFRYGIDWVGLFHAIHKDSDQGKEIQGASLQLWQFLYWFWPLRMPWLILIASIGALVLWSRLFIDLITIKRDKWLRMRRLFKHLLGIKDSQLGTCEFSLVATRLQSLQAKYPISVDRLDAQDIAMRLMRIDNYLIALFQSQELKENKTEVDQNSHLPSLPRLNRVVEMLLCAALKTSLFELSDQGKGLKESVMHISNRSRHARDLSFRLMASAALLIGAWVVLTPGYLLYLVLRYAEEVQTERRTGVAGGSSLTQRAFTVDARWRMRFFNELPHYLDQRLRQALPKACKYLDQDLFANHTLAAIGKGVSMCAGSLAGIGLLMYLLMAVWQGHLVCTLEILPGWNLMLCLTVLAGVAWLSRSLLVPNNPLISSDPRHLMFQVIRHTHYNPPRWQGRLHTRVVYRDIAEMLQPRWKILAREWLDIASGWDAFQLGKLAFHTGELVDFFKSVSVHVPGMGFVCTYSMLTIAKDDEIISVTKDENSFNNHSPPPFVKSMLQARLTESTIQFSKLNPDWLPRDPYTSHLIIKSIATRANREGYIKVLENDDDLYSPTPEPPGCASPANTEDVINMIPHMTLSQVHPGLAQKIHELQRQKQEQDK